jgi:hypothetical protein
MGFLTNTTTIELIAKLTPQGRAKLVSDSDAYYSSYTGLTGGQVPQISGDNAGLDINNGGVDYIIRSTLNLNASTDNKSVNPASISINTKNVSLGFKTINYSGGTITQNKVALADWLMLILMV